MKKSSSPHEKLDRKTVERNRRNHMKNLCFQLADLIPPQEFKSSKDKLSLQDQLDHAATYIEKLKDKIQELKETKRVAMDREKNNNNRGNPMDNNPKLPVIELRDTGSYLQVTLISAAVKMFMTYEIIRIVEDEGAEVVSANFSTDGDKRIHSLHAQVKIPRVGMDTSRMYERLLELISS